MATFVVAPLMMVLVPAAHMALLELDGPHANDPFISHVLGMFGFYGAYAILASSFTSLTHTWLARRRRTPGTWDEVLRAIGLGILALAPQALVFGPEYWIPNLAVGAMGGLVYGLSVQLGADHSTSKQNL